MQLSAHGGTGATPRLIESGSAPPAPTPDCNALHCWPATFTLPTINCH
jgi:hypothetical protein